MEKGNQKWKGKNGTRAAVQKKPRADILIRGPYSTTRTARDHWTGRAVSRLLVPRWTRLRVELTGKMEPLVQDHQKVWDSHMPGFEAPADGRKQGADSSSCCCCCCSSKGARASELLCRMEGCGMVRMEKSGHRLCRWVRAKKEPRRCDGAAYPITDPNCAAVGCWLCQWRCLEVVVAVVVSSSSKWCVVHACCASLPDPATLTQPDAVPSQQDGSSVAFTAASRIEAFSLWQVWAVGRCLVGPHPKPRLSLAEDFTGPPTPHQSWPSCTVVLWGGRSCGATDHPAQAVRYQQAPVEGSPQERRCLVPASQLSARRRRHTRHT